METYSKGVRRARFQFSAGVSSLTVSEFLMMLYLQEKSYRKEGRYGSRGMTGEVVRLSKFESVGLVSVKLVVGVLIFCIAFGSCDLYWTKHRLDEMYLIAENPPWWWGKFSRLTIEQSIEMVKSQIYLELTVVMSFVGLAALIIVGLMLIKRMRTGKAVRALCTP